MTHKPTHRPSFSIPAVKSPLPHLPPLPGQHVKSSNIKSVAYDAATETLQVQFHSGLTYDYSGVPPIAYHGLMNAKSKGSYVREAIAPSFRAVKRET